MAPSLPLRSRAGKWLSTFVCLHLLALPAHADVTRTDIQVAARALSFVSNPLTGAVDVGILYSADSARSVRQAESMRELLADGLRIGALELSPVLVEVGDVARADVDLFFLTEHVPSGVVPRSTTPRSTTPTPRPTTPRSTMPTPAAVAGARGTSPPRHARPAPPGGSAA